MNKRICMPPVVVTNDKKSIRKVKSVIDKSEIVYILDLVTKHHSHGGKAKRYFLLTSSNVSLISTGHIKGIERSHIYSMFNLTKIFYVEPDSFTLTFDHDTISVSTSRAKDMCKMLLFIHSIIFYGCQTKLEVESIPKNSIQLLNHVVRPMNVFQIRLRCFAYLKKTKSSIAIEKYLTENEMKNISLLKIGNAIVTDNTDIFGIAIGMDPDIKCLYFDNFAIKNLKKNLPAVFLNTTSITSIIFDNYTEYPSEAFTLVGNEKTKINDIAFKHCSFPFISTILISMSSFNGRINSLKIENCKLSGEDMKEIFEIITKSPIFMNIKYFYLTEGSIDRMNLSDFSILLQHARNLKFMSISRSSIDTSAIFRAIFECAASLSNISITNGKFLEPIGDDIEIPQCISMIDISQNQISPEAMASLSCAMFHHQRRNVITFYASELASSSTTSDILNAFIVDNPNSILAEIRWSRNELTPEDAEKFFNFLMTQKSLRYMTLSGCFVENVDEGYELLSKFIHKTSVIGLEISACPNNKYYIKGLVKLLKTFVGHKQLQILNLDHSHIGDKGLDVVKQIIDENTDFCSISCDGAKPSNFETLLNFYKHISTVDHLTGVAYPHADFSMFGKSPSMVPELKTKSAPISANQRLLMYAKLSTQMQNKQGPRGLKETLFEDGRSSNQINNPLNDLFVYVNEILNNTNNDNYDEEEEKINEKEEENKEKSNDHKNVKVKVPQPEELCSLLLSSLHTSSVASMSNKFITLDQEKQEKIKLDTSMAMIQLRTGYQTQDPNRSIKPGNSARPGAI